jgi:hypothetical protein
MTDSNGWTTAFYSFGSGATSQRIAGLATMPCLIGKPAINFLVYEQA